MARKLKIDILTLFPEMFDLFNLSMIGRAKKNGIIEINTYNIRDYTIDKHKKTDDYPYGGGAGMVMTPQPIVDSIRSVKESNKGKVIFLGPRGKKFDQEDAKKLADREELIILCGHYEGIDERVYKYIDEEYSLGDFVLTGGEMACIPIVDSICRMIPGVLSKSESYIEESFYSGLLEYPQYTRPEEFEGARVPDVLISGHHENIRKWRRKQALKITKDRRKDLFDKLVMTKEDKKLLNDNEL
ncbi:tRNA (guanine37-N1)-methyltransferase [Clostridium acetobutylicum]|uniref:tRNA (guanine-N(1)-)-methyltransferase n=1 Tax=Clostridium acetobutylicum (strain ATCC 824 / DSM 792 / JCM 1419 / IAM 19013 / LMG 5710 / NBRC 13948 / NRRL B-527 / VKM B-1787 / 2291 / W) TaxID=272562 RepID=TRMD_CLOAB|nr:MULTISPECIES: tRNA (guanosine(37)-N1)-methyltransferase TrmD [Clostridium]Q97I94.1 RecName: Full=tRNA (guanine-N(1)-)-methyltransferase; AltName: Full=M1G-methyltransferase; AltName: Full=tRNA [GM37] methyltransferase [Clostridium acetobutylicum ATCC 824]AAK79724.1 TRNA-(guanine-N1)-methyltransferase, TrmD [Clostridium acetobutylicum ATCC 824]ADZ20808.1 tRNA (guanine-N(1)-)-methyltransferase [Clostridium acetobutylicum EA 2018]AEI33046.1 tRNA (guanine-N(1)-)-methyltransferase [Clostridium ac